MAKEAIVPDSLLSPHDRSAEAACGEYLVNHDQSGGEHSENGWQHLRLTHLDRIWRLPTPKMSWEGPIFALPIMLRSRGIPV